MARRAHDLRRALDVNANGTRMHNRVIVYACVCIMCMCTYMAPHYGRAWCGRRDADYAAHMRLWLVYRIQGAGCMMQVQGELVMLKVYVEW